MWRCTSQQQASTANHNNFYVPTLYSIMALAFIRRLFLPIDEPLDIIVDSTGMSIVRKSLHGSYVYKMYTVLYLLNLSLFLLSSLFFSYLFNPPSPALKAGIVIVGTIILFEYLARYFHTRPRTFQGMNRAIFEIIMMTFPIIPVGGLFIIYYAKPFFSIDFYTTIGILLFAFALAGFIYSITDTTTQELQKDSTIFTLNTMYRSRSLFTRLEETIEYTYQDSASLVLYAVPKETLLNIGINANSNINLQKDGMFLSGIDQIKGPDQNKNQNTAQNNDLLYSLYWMNPDYEVQELTVEEHLKFYENIIAITTYASYSHMAETIQSISAVVPITFVDSIEMSWNEEKTEET